MVFSSCVGTMSQTSLTSLSEKASFGFLTDYVDIVELSKVVSIFISLSHNERWALLLLALILPRVRKE